MLSGIEAPGAVDVSADELERVDLTGFWRAWLVANAAGGAVVAVVGVSLASLLLSLFSPLLFALLGLLLGVAQWLVLRRQADEASLWIFATVSGGFAGACVGVPLAMGMLAAIGQEAWLLSITLVLALIGLVAAGAQWRVLERKAPPPKRWLAAHAAAALSLAATVGVASGLLGQVDGMPPTLTLALVGASGALGGSLYGLISGVALERRLKGLLS